MIAADLVPLAFAVDKLCLLPGNPRRGDVEAVKRSLEAFGQRKPIVARRSDSVVIAGNHTLQAAQALGWSEIAVVWVDDDDTTSKAFALADNRTAELGDYDEAALAELIGQVGSVDPELLVASGWDQPSVQELLNRIEEIPPMVDVDGLDVEPPKIPKTIVGDVWVLGKHRVVCGDSQNQGVYETLMQESFADIVWTDPPYGVSYQMNLSPEEAKRLRRRTDGKEVSNDELTEEQLQNFLRESFTASLSVSKPGAVWYVAAPPGPRFVDFGIVLIELGVWRQTLAWVKDQFVMGRSDYHGRHEAIFYGWAPGAAHHPPPDRKQDTVWEIARPKRSDDHPTMKPIALITRALENSSDKGDIVLDPFGGSGSTLLASQLTGRVARLIELDPKYVDVICRRFQEATGIVPVNEATGREHDFLNG